MKLVLNFYEPLPYSLSTYFLIVILHINLQDLQVKLEPSLETISVEEPAKRKGGVILSSAAELVDRLKNEAKVL